MTIFKGAGTALVTPFHENGSVNYDKFKELIEFQIEGGIDALIICGTTGEASTLTEDEQIECVRFAADIANKRIPIIGGAGSNDTDCARALARGCEKAGADGLLIVTPYYNKTTQKGLVEHFEIIAKDVNIPIIMYSIEGRTGMNIAPKTVLELSKIENIVGIKEASGNISQCAEIAYLCGGAIDMYSGNDDMILPLLSVGGKGVISTMGNIIPKDVHDIVTKYWEGDLNESLRLQLQAIPLIKALFCEVNPIPIKHALNLMGFEVGPLRRPLCKMDGHNLAFLKAEMQRYGLIE